MVTLLDTNKIKEQLKNRILENIDTYTSIDKNNVYHLNLSVADLVDTYIKEKEIQQPKLYITSDAYTKMQLLIQNTATEIGWYGTVEKHPDINSYIINDIIVYPQTVTSATCEQDEDKMFEFEMSLTDDQVNHKRFHGHSHVNMGVTPSTTDEDFYTKLLAQVTDYFIILIKNKRNEQTVRFYDMDNGLCYSDLPIYIINETGLNLNDWYDHAIDENITKYTPPTTVYKSASTNKYAETKKKYNVKPMTDEEWDAYLEECKYLEESNPYNYVAREKDYFV